MFTWSDLRSSACWLASIYPSSPLDGLPSIIRSCCEPNVLRQNEKCAKKCMNSLRAFSVWFPRRRWWSAAGNDTPRERVTKWMKNVLASVVSAAVIGCRFRILDETHKRTNRIPHIHTRTEWLVTARTLRFCFYYCCHSHDYVVSTHDAPWFDSLCPIFLCRCFSFFRFLPRSPTSSSAPRQSSDEEDIVSHFTRECRSSSLFLFFCVLSSSTHSLTHTTRDKYISEFSFSSDLFSRTGIGAFAIRRCLRFKRIRHMNSSHINIWYVFQLTRS